MANKGKKFRKIKFAFQGLDKLYTEFKKRGIRIQLEIELSTQQGVISVDEVETHFNDIEKMSNYIQVMFNKTIV